MSYQSNIGPVWLRDLSYLPDATSSFALFTSLMGLVIESNDSTKQLWRLEIVVPYSSITAYRRKVKVQLWRWNEPRWLFNDLRDGFWKRFSWNYASCWSWFEEWTSSIRVVRSLVTINTIVDNFGLYKWIGHYWFLTVLRQWSCNDRFAVLNKLLSSG